jgi:SAM-dependent methyltransferase
MVLSRLIKGVLSASKAAPDANPSEFNASAQPASAVPRVLNVGGGSKQIAIPDHYSGWDHVLLDIAPSPDADIVQDARNLAQLESGQFDAVYCSHNLEHYFRHDAVKVLAGFMHVLKPDGFAEIRVPDMKAVIAHMVESGMDLDDVLYTSPGGPISAHDVFYGWGKQIESSGVDFYAHKCGFTAKSLGGILTDAGFTRVGLSESGTGFEIRALAFKTEPTDAQKALLKVG